MSLYGHTFIKNVYDREAQEVRSLVYLVLKQMSLMDTYAVFHLFVIINVSKLEASQIGSPVMYSCTVSNRILYKACYTTVYCSCIFSFERWSSKKKVKKIYLIFPPFS